MEYIAIKNIERIVFSENTNTLVIGLTSGNEAHYHCTKQSFENLIKHLENKADEWGYIDMGSVKQI